MTSLALSFIAAASLQNAGGPCSAEVYQQYDFWLGHWEVMSGDTPAGRSVIEKTPTGCGIVQHWTAADGQTGVSVSHYEASDGRWHQTWVGDTFSVRYAGGLDRQGAMVLEGTLSAFGSDLSLPFRGRWLPVGDDRIVQRFHYRDAETGEWKDWFQGTSRRLPAAESPAGEAER
ncbi:hypothetical protein [Parvularcula maris]|uniref:DUF1579 domain-containing protein n=1 Tax=Parvularcula maris TaxID=2965077 RepID=A0A9X2L7I7_9PROT|nr:hypothetical protein [Parvularcula maris]MCQ8184504.1 hypothetical protein [Parvularcula maris]